jgi:hypothetical protein
MPEEITGSARGHAERAFASDVPGVMGRLSTGPIPTWTITPGARSAAFGSACLPAPGARV